MEIHSFTDRNRGHKDPTTANLRLDKGMGFLEREVGSEAIAELGWNLLHEDVSLPSAVLYEDRLLHNLNWMQKFIAVYGISLAPHGKTSMAPKLFELQL